MPNDDELCAALNRIADAFTRLADHFCPIEKKRNPASLGVAMYSEQEKEARRIRLEIKGKKKPAR